MSTSAITLQPQQQSLSITETRMSAAQLIEQRKAIVEVMQSAMKKDQDYGIIPGTPKPTLYKPGSEKILAIFHLGIRPRVEELSTEDTIRYRVHCEIFHQPTGQVLGVGVGEASSAESKYQWRAVICDEEWDSTPEDRSRIKWKKGERGPYSVRQVRADMEDVANTVLKMAKKRAQIDATLTTTAASDIFAQDLEELKAAGLDPDEDDKASTTTTPAEGLQKKADAPKPQAATAPATSGAKCISEAEAKRFWAVAINRTNDYKLIMDYLKSVHGVTNKNLIIGARYTEAMKWAESGVVED
jgi:hypothetical protein